MMKLTKDKLRIIKDQINDLKYQISITTEKINMQEIAIKNQKNNNNEMGNPQVHTYNSL